MINRELKKLSTDQQLNNLVAGAEALGYSVAVWSLPQEQHFHLIVDCSESPQIGKVAIETAPPGFIVSPFINKAGEKIHYLMADIYYQSTTGDLHIDPAISSEKSEKIDRFFEVLNTSFKRNTRAREGSSFNKDFLQLVEQCLAEIKGGRFEKIVVSGTRNIDLTATFDPIDKLVSLRKAYPNAFCYFLSSPTLGTWMAATPELLLSIDKEKQFKTVALAGTQKLEDEQHLTEIAWTQKEIEEQALVSRYIINAFKKIRLREFEEKGPKTVKAGNLAHLKTEFTVDMNAINFPQLGTVMLDLLHPTSAVCGMPLDESMDFLIKNEAYDRSLFAGFLGPVNINGDTNIFVNLRCMQLLTKYAILYAGAGLTADSVPWKELEETEMKFRTLLNIME